MKCLCAICLITITLCKLEKLPTSCWNIKMYKELWKLMIQWPVSKKKSFTIFSVCLHLRFRSLISVWLAFTWLIPITVVVTPHVIWEEKILGYNFKYGSCLPKNAHPATELYNFIVVGVCFPLPFLVILTSFIIIVINMRNHSRDLLKGPGASDVTSAIQDNTKLRLHRRQVQITKNMMVVVCVFFFMIGLYCLGVVIPDTAPSMPFMSLVLYSSSFVNPFIYAKHPHFREIFGYILKRRWSDIPEKTTFLKLLLDI